jgi:hypothetical protein
MCRQKSFLGIILAIGVLLTSTAIHAQVTTATIYGNVTDATGAQLPGAVVTITNEQTNAAQSAPTNADGEFTFNFLQVGRYSITIVSNGFKEQTQSGVELTGGQRVRLNYALEVGSITEKVTVTAETPLINAVNAEQLISHPTVEVRELPLARRDWTNLLNVGTGVEVRTSGGGTGVVLNGLPPGGISLTVDGTQGSGSTEETSITSFGNFNLIKVVSLEAISEVNVTKGIVPAEYSNTLSGNIGIITKSGTNEFHGSLFENYLGRFLNARNQFAAIRPNEVFNQFGGSFGGPIIKNKLFFFGVYEGYRQRRFSNLNEQVPTAEFRARAIAAVPAYREFFDAFPLPTQPYAAGAQTSAFIGTTPVRANDNHFVIRGDYNINDSNRLSSRYTRGRPDSLSFLGTTVYPFLFTGLDDTFTTSYFRTGSSYSSETRFGFNRNDVTRLLGLNLDSGGIVGIGGFSFSPGGGEILASRGKGWSIEEVVAFNRGRHSIKLGGIFQHQNQTRENSESPTITYTSEADLLANIPTTVSVTFGVLPYVIKDWANGYFIQDDFKIRPNLVLNLGLRYDYFSVPKERDNRLFNREEPFGLGAIRSPEQGLFNTDKNNFAPRVGFAWTVDDAGKTVVRGGFGVFYTRAPLRNVIDTIRNSLTEPFRFAFSRAEAQALGLRYPVSPDSVRSLVPVLPWSGTTINPEFPNPYSMQWILSFQRQLTNTIALDTAYVGSRGLNLIFNRDINQVNRVTGIRPFAAAGFGQFRHFDTSDSTTYHAWQTSVQKRFSNNFLFNVNYTWSRTISFSGGDLSSLANPQDVNNIALERGPSPFDITHRFSTDFLYVLPFAKMWGSDSTAKRLLYDGWQLGGIMKAESGAPFSLFNPNNALPNNSQRIDYLGGQVYLDNSDSTLQYLNPAAFATVPLNPVSRAPVRPGTLGRNALRLPGFWEVDLSLAKSLAVTERFRVQLRADFFNALNHTNFSAIQVSRTAATFGRFTATRGARTGQLSVRITF